MKTILFAVVFLFSLAGTIRPQNYSFQLNGGPLFLTNSEYANTGYNLSAAMFYHFSDHIDLSLRSGYLHWSSKEESVVHIFNFSNYNIPLLTGIRYYFLSNNIRPYAGTEIGISFIQTKQKNDIYLAQTYNKILPKEKVGTRSRFSLGLSGGLILLLGKDINLDVNITVQHPEVSLEYMQLSTGIGIGIL